MDEGTLVILVWLVSAWILYLIIKYAVRNGILAADDARTRRERYAAAYARELALERLNGGAEVPDERR
jgi:hypothetical protein